MQRAVATKAATSQDSSLPAKQRETFVESFSTTELQSLTAQEVTQVYDETRLIDLGWTPYGPRHRDGSLVMRNDYHYVKIKRSGELRQCIVRVPQIYKRYELCVVYNPYLKDSVREYEIARMEAHLKRNGAIMVTTIDRGCHDMAKKLKRASQGHYVLYYFFMEGFKAPTVLQFLENPRVGLETAILASHFTKKTRPPKSQGPHSLIFRDPQESSLADSGPASTDAEQPAA